MSNFSNMYNHNHNYSKATANPPESADDSAKRLAKELEAVLSHTNVVSSDVAAMQLATARTLRQLLPTNPMLLLQVQQGRWVPVLLSWLNLHDRPAVQVEALLCLTYMAELCSTQPSSMFGANSAMKEFGANNAMHEFPFPPLSFSQVISPDSMASLDASLTSHIHAGSNNSQATTASPNTVSSSSPFLPPPTTASFPAQLSPASQHFLLRHADAIPTLISLLSHPDVYEQSLWILGSIAAGDSGSNTSADASTTSTINKAVAARDVILAAGIMNPLLRCMEVHKSQLSLQRIGSWCLSHLVEGIFQQQQPSSSSSHGGNTKANSSLTNNSNNGSSHTSTSHHISSDYSSSDEIEMDTLLPCLRRLLFMTDAEVLSYTCWTLSHLCDGPSSHISAVTTSKSSSSPRGGLVPRLVELLGHASWRVTKPALRTIGNIVCAECSEESSTDYTEIILDCHAVPKLKELVTHSNREIQKEACWTLSNIAAGTVDQIQAVIDSGAIAPLVVLVSDKTTDQEVRSEACWVVLNATSCGSDAQIEVLVDEGCVSVLGVLLGETSMVMMALEGLERVLQVEEARASDEALVSANLIEKALDKHQSSAVTKRATRIWKQHFVSCALCHKSYSKHRTSDATFCDECKCYVCSSCDCKIYHLDYQEELWAATEEQNEAKKASKKSKKAKKKEKQKQKAIKAKDDDIEFAPDVNRFSENNNKDSANQSSTAGSDASDTKAAQTKDLDKDDDIGNELEDEGDEDPEQQQPPIDFVLYLQQTGSIIALAKLMDALEYDDDDFVDAELEMFRTHQRQDVPATNKFIF